MTACQSGSLAEAGSATTAKSTGSTTGTATPTRSQILPSMFPCSGVRRTTTPTSGSTMPGTGSTTVAVAIFSPLTSPIATTRRDCLLVTPSTHGDSTWSLAAAMRSLVAPAVCAGGFDWLRGFLNQCSGCHIDFIPVHWYGGANYEHWSLRTGSTASALLAVAGQCGLLRYAAFSACFFRNLSVLTLESVPR